MKELLRVCVCLLFLQTLTRLSTSQAPSLSRALLSNYTINPLFHPSFPYCKFSGNPTPSVSWSFNGDVRLPADESEGGPYYKSGSGVLVLTNAQTGLYTCTGVNELGSSSATTVITVTSTPAVPWYLMPYMYFVYALAVWVICTVLIVILYCKKRRLVDHDLPPRDHETLINMNTLTDNIPPEWQPQSHNSCTDVYPVVQGFSEWSRIEQKFKATMPNAQIATISRIQNKWLWDKYHQHKMRLNKKLRENINEMELFHGTRGNDPKLIYEGEHGFDMRYSNQGMWGQANYFAVNASYCNDYSYRTPDGFKEIFWVKVLTGDSHRCEPNRSLRKPPVKPTGDSNESGSFFQLSRPEYDTVTGETGGSQVFMTYDNDKAYPAYLIKFS